MSEGYKKLRLMHLDIMRTEAVPNYLSMFYNPKLLEMRQTTQRQLCVDLVLQALAGDCDVDGREFTQRQYWAVRYSLQSIEPLIGALHEYQNHQLIKQRYYQAQALDFIVKSEVSIFSEYLTQRSVSDRC